MKITLKKTSFLLLAAVCIIAVISAAVFMKPDTNYTVPPEYKNIKVGVGRDRYPYCFTTSDGEVTGFNIDIIKALALETGIDVSFVKINDSEPLLSMIQNKADCIISIDPKNILPEYITYSDMFLDNKMSIFINSYDMEIKSTDDLKNKRVSVCKDDPYIDIISSIDKVRLLVADNVEIAMEIFLLGISDAYAGDLNTGIAFLIDSDNEDKVKHIGDVDFKWMSSIITTQDNYPLTDLFNRGFKNITSNGTVDTITAKWFGKDIVSSSAFIRKMIFVFCISAALIAAVLIAFIRINLFLKKEVAERTLNINEEKQLKESIIQSLYEGLIYTDPDGYILLSNPSASLILKESENMTGKNIYEIPSCRVFKKEHLSYVLESSESITEQEGIMNGSKRPRYIEYSMTPVSKSSDQAAGMTITFRDITEEKNLKAKLQTKDKLESIGRLTAGIAHEIRNPLTSIGMFIKLLPSKIDNEIFREQLVEEVPKEIKRLDEIIKNLLDYAKPQPSKKQVFNLREEIEQTMSLLSNQLNKNNILLIINVDSSLSVNFDRQQFKQVIINLMINSIDELKTISREEKKIYLESQVSENSVILTVSDNGEGIGPDKAGLIFDPFYSTKDDGYGLGLSIVAQIIKENNSEISVDTSYEDGAKFVITIPADKKEA